MKDTIKFWNKQAKNFNSNGNEETMDLLNKSEKYLNDNDIVLDFACGTGDSTIGIAKHVKEIVGIDISEEMIKYAGIKVEKSQLTNINLITTTLDDNKFLNESFDVIVAFNIIHLVDDLNSTMKRVNTLLKPNGLFISSTACMGDKGNFVSRLINFISKFGFLPDITSYSCSELEEAICSFDFNTVESIKIDDKVPNLYLVVKKGDS